MPGIRENTAPVIEPLVKREKVTSTAISKKNKTEKRMVGFWKNPASLVLPHNTTCSRPTAEMPTEGVIYQAALQSNSATSTFLSSSSFCPSYCLKRDPANTHTLTQLNTIPNRKREILCWSPHERLLLHHFVPRDALPIFSNCIC